MTQFETYEYDKCPRCGSVSIEVTDTMHAENMWAVEHLACKECGLDFEQHYQYAGTFSEYDGEEDGDYEDFQLSKLADEAYEEYLADPRTVPLSDLMREEGMR